MPGSTEIKKDPSHVARDYGLSETAYSCGYDLRLRYSSFMQDTLAWVAHHHDALLPENDSKVLSLGCGSGIFDTELINVIRQYNSDWTYAGLDFSSTDLDLFRKKLSSMDKQTQANISLHYQKFSPALDLGERYDLITMVHFLHSFDDVTPIIRNALSHLSPGGKLLIVHQNRRGIADLKASLSHLLYNKKFHSSEDIKAWLDAEKVTYSFDVIDTHFDVSILHTMSLDALLLMSFCLSNDLSVLHTREQEEIRNAFIDQARVGTDGAMIMDEQMEVIACHA